MLSDLKPSCLPPERAHFLLFSPAGSALCKPKLDIDGFWMLDVIDSEQGRPAARASNSGANVSRDV